MMGHILGIPVCFFFKHGASYFCNTKFNPHIFFILEFGKDFTFIGEEYRIQVYLEASDRDVKKNENPSVGLILCAGKDDTVVEFVFYIGCGLSVTFAK